MSVGTRRARSGARRAVVLGAGFIGVALIVAVLGAYLSWTLMAAEVLGRGLAGCTHGCGRQDGQLGRPGGAGGARGPADALLRGCGGRALQDLRPPLG